MFGSERLNQEIESDIKNHIDTVEDTIYNVFNKKDDTVYNQDKYEFGDVLPAATSTTSLSTSGALKMILEFYAKSGVNLPSKMNELLEFQKAYSLLLGVLYQAHYDQSRIPIIFEQLGKDAKSIALHNFWGILTHRKKLMNIYKAYKENKAKYDNLVSQTLAI